MSWTKEQYIQFWENEKRVEAVIKAGKFSALIRNGLEAAEKEVRIKQGETIINKIKKLLWR